MDEGEGERERERTWGNMQSRRNNAMPQEDRGKYEQTADGETDVFLCLALVPHVLPWFFMFPCVFVWFPTTPAVSYGLLPMCFLMSSSISPPVCH